MPSGKGGSQSQITGYRYIMSVHFGLGRGPQNELTEIRAGDLPAWQGSVTESTAIEIDAPNLFGGDQKEGGLKGTAKLLMGEATQVIDDIIKSNLEGGFPTPEWRGVTSVFYYGQIGSNNPYPKPWKFRVNRQTAGWDREVPFPELARIDMMSQPLTFVSFNVQPVSGNSMFIGDVEVDFFTSVVGDSTNVQIGADITATASNFAAMCNLQADELFGVTATADGTVVSLVFPTSVVVSAGNGSFFTTSASGGLVKAMNPAHIIYECATNNLWGRGLPESFIDKTNFQVTMQKLFDEGFGLCIRWNRQEDIDKFIAQVIQHIGGAVYIHRRTGLLTMKLFRKDYDVDDLTELTFENGIIDITEDESSSSDTVYNEVIVKFNDPVSNKTGSLRVHNLASFQSIGSLLSVTTEYPGIPTAGLAARIAQRDLQANSAEVRRMKIKMDRAGWFISPGDVFKISIPSRGIESMVMRAYDITDGPLEDETILITAIQDIFSLPDTSFVTPQPSFWTPPDRSPRVISPRLVDEMTYYDVSESLPPGELIALAVDSGILKIFAAQPTGSNQDYIVSSKTSSESDFVDRNIAGFDAEATLSIAIGYHDTAATIINIKQPNYLVAGMPILLVKVTDITVQEFCELVSFDLLTGGIVIKRGCIDTIPHSFGIGDVVWFQSHMPTTDFRDYAISETVNVKLLSRTSSAVLDPSLAPTDNVDIVARQGKPYPPGNMQINGIPFEDTQSIAADVELTWAHRDRLTQGNFLLDTTEASTGPEAGTTYTVRVYDGSDPEPTTLLRTEDGITDDFFTYTTAMAITDGDLREWWFEVESVRDAKISFQMYRFFVKRPTGFGEGFDFGFDGGL